MAAIPTIRTARLTLRPFAASDAMAMGEMLSDPRVTEFVPAVPCPCSSEWAAGWIASLEGWAALGLGLNWGIVLTGTGEVAGAINLMDVRQGSAELGCLTGRRFWHRMLAPEASRAVVGYGFDALGLSRIYAGPANRNCAVAPMLRRIGMRQVQALPSGVLTRQGLEDGSLWEMRKGEAPCRS